MGAKCDAAELQRVRDGHLVAQLSTFKQSWLGVTYQVMSTESLRALSVWCANCAPVRLEGEC